MRSVPAGSFDRLTDLAALWRAFLACRQGKARQPRMAEFDLDPDTRLVKLHRELREGRYRPDPWRTRIVRDPKLRLIAAPSVRDRVLHRALLDEIGPAYERAFVPLSFARGRGLGPHRAVLGLLAAMRHCRFRLLLDVRRYFPSVHRPTLLQLFARRLRPNDAATLDLIRVLLEANGAIYRSDAARRVMKLDVDPLPADAGLGLGSHLSQWCGAMYLDGLDHHVLRVLRPGAYLRYMDDFVLCDDDRGKLDDARTQIANWLRCERGLELDPKRRHVVPCSEACVFLGYRVSRAGITPSRKLRRRFDQRVRAAAERGPDALTRTIAAYRGLLLF